MFLNLYFVPPFYLLKIHCVEEEKKKIQKLLINAAYSSKATSDEQKDETDLGAIRGRGQLLSTAQAAGGSDVIGSRESTEKSLEKLRIGAKSDLSSGIKYQMKSDQGSGISPDVPQIGKPIKENKWKFEKEKCAKFI